MKRGYTMSLAARYKEARLLAGHSQSEMADLLNSTQTSISKIEQGLVLNPRNLDKHAEILGVTESYLRFGSNNDTDAVSNKNHSPEYQIITRNLEQLERNGQLRGEIFQIINSALSLANIDRTTALNS